MLALLREIKNNLEGGPLETAALLLMSPPDTSETKELRPFAWNKRISRRAGSILDVGRSDVFNVRNDVQLRISF